MARMRMHRQELLSPGSLNISNHTHRHGEEETVDQADEEAEETVIKWQQWPGFSVGHCMNHGVTPALKSCLCIYLHYERQQDYGQ